MRYADPYFLGDPKPEPDRYTPKYKVRFNANGFNEQRRVKDKKAAKWLKNGMPESVLASLRAFPDHPGGIAGLIDDAVDKVKAQFAACGGELANKAAKFDPRRIYVVIEPSAMFEPRNNTWAAGFFSPDDNEIHVVNLFYHFDGPNKGWLRNAPDLLTYEFANAYAYHCDRQPYPRTEYWPCDAMKR